MTDVGGEWYLNNMRNIKPSTKKPRLSDKKQEGDKKFKGELKDTCDHWKDWKFQIVPLKQDTKKTPFLCLQVSYFSKYCLQDNHWVGN